MHNAEYREGNGEKNECKGVKSAWNQKMKNTWDKYKDIN